MGFDPSKPFDVVSAPAPAAGGFDPSKPFDVVPQAAPAPTPSAIESLGRGALQGASLGFSDELTGAIESLFTKKGYSQARDESRAANDAARSEHPYLYGGGEIAGGLAGAVVPGAALAKGAALAGEGTALARGLGAASKVAEAVTGSGGSGIGSVAARSALGGGVAGLGASDSNTLAGAAKDVGVGALTGGVVGGALHGIGSKLASKAPEKYETDIATNAFAKSRPKDALSFTEVRKANPEAYKEMVYSDAFKPIQKALAKKDTAGAVAAINDFVDKAGANRLNNYAELPAEGHITVPGPIVDRMFKVAANEQPAQAEAIRKAAEHIKTEFATVDTSLIKEGDAASDQALAQLKPFLPDRRTLTKSEFQDAAIKLARTTKPNANYGDTTNDIHQAIESLPFKFDPNAEISLVHLRKVATQAQGNTKATLGSIAETERYKIVRAVDDSINDGLNADLDKAAKVSTKAKAAVERIRHDNKQMSMGLAMQDGIETVADKESLGKGQTTGSTMGNLVKTVGHTAGVGEILHGMGTGDVAAIGKGVAYMAAPHVLGAAGKAARAGNDTLARFIHAAGQGNPYAIKTINALKATPAGAARIAALMATQGSQ